MSVLAWVVLAVVAGFIASKLYCGAGQGALVDFLLGVVGATVGGWLFHQFGMSGIGSFNLYSLLVAIVGASVVLVLYHAIFGSVR